MADADQPAVTPAGKIARLLLRMNAAEIGRVEILHGDFHAATGERRRAIGEQLTALVEEHARDGRR